MSGRMHNSLRNIFFGMLNSATVIIFPFVIRTILIQYLGEEYLGLNSLFKSILQVLNLADLGLSSAIIASMYKPIAENNVQQVSALMNLYKRIYRAIGSIILLIGIAICPFIQNFINGSPPAGINIYATWIMYLANTVASYLLFGYKISLIHAHQRSDIVEISHMIIRILISIIQIILVVRYKSMYAYILLNVLFTIASNIWCGYLCDKYYPQYSCSGELNEENKKQIIQNICALALQKIGGTVSVSLDSIIISAFMGLASVAIYGNYFYVISAITSFLNLIYHSITASIGNSIVTETVEKNQKDFRKFTFLSIWLTGWCSICFMCLFQDFMILWMGEELLFGIGTVFCLVLRFYFEQIRRTVQTYKDAAGMWWADKWKPIVGCVINLSLNIFLVQKIGVTGVLISTVISYVFVEMPWETHALFKNYFGKSAKEYYKSIVLITCVMIVIGVLTYKVCNIVCIVPIWNLIVKALICVVVPNILFALVFLKNSDFREGAVFMLKIGRSILRKQ